MQCDCNSSESDDDNNDDDDEKEKMVIGGVAHMHLPPLDRVSWYRKCGLEAIAVSCMVSDHHQD